MSKRNSSPAKAASAVDKLLAHQQAKAEQPKAAAPAAKTVVLQVVKQPAKPFRTGSARDLYWQAVQAHNGKPLAELAAAVAKTPPSTPAKGKLAGQVEPLSGWLSWFKAQGLITIG